MAHVELTGAPRSADDVDVAIQRSDTDVIAHSVSESWFRGEKRPDLKTFGQDAERPTMDMLTRGRLGNLVRTSTARKAEAQRDKFGMFDGVVTPCLLNIWGVIMYLRTGWVVGRAGIVYAIVIIIGCSMVTTFTTLSLSAICTNGDVQGGGAYFLISRALGPEFGGTVGIMFYLANAIVHAIYVIGFADGLVDIIKGFNGGDYFSGSLINDTRLVSLGTMAFIMVMAFVGIKAILRFQVVLLVLLVASIITFFVTTASFSPDAALGFTGYNADTLAENMWPDWGDQNFFSVFAIFFPAVTGIVAGANISGDLKDPAAAIPKGTLGAIALSSTVYIIIAVVFGATIRRYADEGGLIDDFLIMIHTAKSAAFVLYAGLLAATLSSAIASMVGAPRVLQAFARDKIVTFLGFFGKGVGPNDEPVPGYALTFLVALPLVISANINAISPLVTNFFLVSYALINWACFAQTIAKTPGWRPTFKYYNAWTAGAGFALCMGVMFLIDVENNCLLALATCGIGIALYKYVEHKSPDVNWGAAVAGRSYVVARRALFKLDNQKTHVKNFRPSYLVLTGDIGEREHLVSLAGLLKKGGGISVCGNILDGRLEPLSRAMRRRALSMMSEHGLPVPADVPTTITEDDDEDAAPEAKPAEEVKGEVEGDIRDDDDDMDADGDPAAVVTLEDFHHAQNKHAAALERARRSKLKVQAIGKVFCSTDFPNGALSMMQLVGLGQLQPNTIMLGYQTPAAGRKAGASAPSVSQADYVSTIRKGLNFGYNVCIAKNFEQFDFTKKHKGSIDIWWLSDDGGLTLLVAHLLNRHKHMAKCKLRAMVVSDKDHIDLKVARTQTLMDKLRFPVEVVPVTARQHKPTSEAVEAFNQLSVGPNTFSPATHTSVAGVRSIFGITASPNPAIKRSTSARETDVVNKRLVLLGEYIGICSGAAAVTVVSLPVPRSKESPETYMARLDMMTKGVGPCLMVRGNQSSVLTFRA